MQILKKKLKYKLVFRNARLSRKSELRSAISKIYGIGFTKAFIFMAKLGFSYPFPTRYLNNYYFIVITTFLSKILSGTVRLKKIIQTSIKTNIDLGTYKGRRH